MHSDARIPIMVGVTGHRMLEQAALPALRIAVMEQLTKLRARCPHSPMRMLNSLAQGADQLCAEVAVALNIPLVVPLPMEYARYRMDFSGPALAGLERLIEQAEQVFVSPRTEAAQAVASRDDAYRQAGLYVVRHAHVLLALWDGGEANCGGCGTAEMVDCMLNGSYEESEGTSLRPDGDGTVLWIGAPRAFAAKLKTAETTLLGNAEVLEQTLLRTDAFNAEAATASGDDPNSPVLAAVAAQPKLGRLATVYAAADGLSCAYAKKNVRALGLLAVCGTVLALAFLLYDELEAPAFLIVCGAMLIAGGGLFLQSKKTGAHEKYLEYRALAETIRVQVFLLAAGLSCEVTSLFAWTQRVEAVWIKEAANALTAGLLVETGMDTRSCWLCDQRDYHRRALKKSRGRLRVSERIVKAALAATITVYVAALGFELLAGGIGEACIPISMQALTWIRTGVKILLGSLSAATLFIANYYGKLSLPRKVADHEKMAQLYVKALERLERAQLPHQRLLKELAREELIENGNWLSYNRDNKPDLNL